MNGLAHAAVPSLSGPALDNKRVGAGLVDLLVLFFVGFLIGALGGGYTPAAGLVSVAWGLYYYFALEALTGQTLGKKLMGLRVANADGSPPEIRQIAVRSALRLVDGLGLYVVGLVAMLATGERRQRLGDLAAGTIITTAEDEEPPPESALDTPAEDTAPLVPLHAEEPAVPAAAPAPVAPVEDPPDFEHYKAPEPAPVVEAAPEPHIELVPEPAAEGEEPRIKIVSPMDVVMGEDEQDEPPPQPA